MGYSRRQPGGTCELAMLVYISPCFSIQARDADDSFAKWPPDIRPNNHIIAMGLHLEEAFLNDVICDVSRIPTVATLS